MRRQDHNGLSVITNILRALVPIAVILVITTGMTALCMFITVRMGILGGSDSYQNWVMQNGLIVVGLTDAVAAVILAWQAKKDRLLRTVRVEEHPAVMSAKDITMVLIAALALCLLFNLITNLMPIIPMTAASDTASAVLSGSGKFVQLVVAGILAPLAEELCFRIVMFRRLREWLKLWPAILISAIAFGCYHGNLAQGIYGFLLGILFAYVTSVYENAVLPIVMHVAANMLIMFTDFSGLLSRMVDRPATGWTVSGVCLVLLVVSLLFINRTARAKVTIADCISPEDSIK